MTNKYHNKFLGSYASENIIAIFSRYKNASKEITESYAMLSAWKEHLPCDDTVFVVVGDGGSPRTGAMLSYFTNGTVISVDPNMNLDHWHEHTRKQEQMGFPVQRLTTVKGKIEDISIHCEPKQSCCIVFPHSHADMRDVDVVGAERISCIAMPCCVPIPDVFMRMPHIVYSDQHVISPKREVHIWDYTHSEELLGAIGRDVVPRFPIAAETESRVYAI